MRPSDEVPFEESDYSDVALLLAAARCWPEADFARELDGRAGQRFAAPRAGAGAGAGFPRRRRLARHLGVAAMGLSLAAGAALVAVTGGGLSGAGPQRRPPVPREPLAAGPATSHSGAVLTLSKSSPRAGAPVAGSAFNGAATLGSAAKLPVVPGARQIRSAQIDLTTRNQHVNQVAEEIIGVVSFEHGTVMSSQVTAASVAAGGGYATFTLSIPDANLQTTVSQLSRLRYADLSSSTAGSQNVSDQYASDQRQLTDAQALRVSLLKELASATTQQQIDSINAQLKLAAAQVTRWQRALASLKHRISYSDVSLQVNAGGLPVLPVSHRASVFTLGRAAHDALRVLIVAAGVALIALALAIPLGLVLALLVWLWLWSRRRRREQALDQTA